MNLYGFICLLITLGLAILALTVARWRDKRFWLNVALLILTISLASLWKVYPFLAASDSTLELAMWHGESEIRTDAISYAVNLKNPIYGRWLGTLAPLAASNHLSETSYLGYLPLLLIAAGLYNAATRRKMAPWVFLCALFLILRLGSRLTVNGTVYSGVILPKHYLNQLLPEVFVSFWEADLFMIGALLPLAVLVCFGLATLKERFALAAKPSFALALIAIVALEYHIPVSTDRVFPVGDGTISQERLAFLDWLDQEAGDVRLINLPMGRPHAKIYGLYQSLSGFPHAEGAISRTPDSAFDYIRANLLLNVLASAAAHQLRTGGPGRVSRWPGPAGSRWISLMSCFHRDIRDAAAVKASFRAAKPAYEK